MATRRGCATGTWLLFTVTCLLSLLLLLPAHSWASEGGSEAEPKSGARPRLNPPWFEELLDQGYAGRDIARAGAIQTATGLDPEAALEALAAGHDWDEIWAAADLMAKLGSDFQELLARRRVGESWEAIATAESAGRSVVISLPMSTRAALSPAEIEALLAAGDTLSEIATADRLALILGVDMRKVIAERLEGEPLMVALRRVEEERPPAERAAFLRRTSPEEERMVDYHAAVTGLSADQIRILRAERKSWYEITRLAIPDDLPAGAMTQYEFADLLGITDHILVERATELGLTVIDIANGFAAAEMLGMAVEDVLAMKTTRNQWHEVIAALGLRFP